MAQNQDDKFQRLMNEGYSAAWDMDWDSASTHYRQALKTIPDHPLALTNLGLALFELKDDEEALKCYRKVQQMSPEDPIPLEKISVIYERQGKIHDAASNALKAAELYIQIREINKAIENWKRVVRLETGNLRAHSRLALVFERIGNKKRAVEEFLIIASLLQEIDEIGKAAQTIKHALQLEPGNESAIKAFELLKKSEQIPKPRVRYTSTTKFSKEHEDTLKDLKEEIEHIESPDPVDEAKERALSVLAGMLFEDTDADREVGYKESSGIDAISGDNRDINQMMSHLTKVIDFQSKGENKLAVDELKLSVDAGLDHPAAYFDLGYLSTETERLESAIRNLQYAVESTEYALGSRLLLGRIMSEMGKLEAASVEYLEGLKLADMSVVPESQAGDLSQLYQTIIDRYKELEDPQTHQQICENVSDLLMQENWRAQLHRARVQLHAQPEGSPPVPLAEIITQASSNRIVDILNKVSSLEKSGLPHSAMEEMFYALEFAPMYLPLHKYIGELLLKQDRLQEAIDKFVIIARSYEVRGQIDQAVDIYKRALELAPLELDPRERLINILISQGMVNKAIDQYIQLADVHYNLAGLDEARVAYSKALEYARESNVEDSWETDILHYQADIELQCLEWQKAMQYFKEIRRVKPEDEKARTAIIETLYKLDRHKEALSELDDYLNFSKGGQNLTKAVDFLKDFVHENPDQPSLRIRLAQLYNQVGRKDDAIKQYDTLGEILLEAGDRDGAIKVVETILRLKPDEVKGYRRLLEKIKTGEGD